jgi:diguanylate cyclase (GGDEF)-like protein
MRAWRRDPPPVQRGKALALASDTQCVTSCSDPPPGGPAPSRPGAGAVRAWLFNAVLLGGAVALFTVGIRHLSAPVEIPFLPWWLLGALFCLTEAVPLHVAVRHEAHKFNLSDLPLLLAAAVLPGPGVALAVVTGALGGLIADRRKPPLHAVANLTSMLFYNAFAVVAYRLVLGPGAPTSGRGWLAAAAGTAALMVISNLTVTLGIALESGRWSRVVEPATGVGLVVAAVTSTTLALLVLDLASGHPAALGLLGLLAGLLLAACRVATQAWRRNTKLEILYQIVGERAADTGSLGASLLTRVRDLLGCAVAEVVLYRGDGAGGPLRLRLAHDDRLHADSPDAAELRGTLAGRVAACGRSLVAGQPGGEADGRAHVAGQDRRHAIAVPLRGEGGVIGIVAAAERRSLQRFDAADVELLETVAAHAAAVLDNSILVDRLRHEAASREYDATHDALTGLANRGLLRSQLDSALAEALPRAAPVSVLLIDLDRFKRINDTWGHHVGDAVLQEMATRLRAAVPTGSTVGRLGGDEFAVVLPAGGDRWIAEAVAADVRLILAEPVTVEGNDFTCGASVGVALSPDDGVDSPALLRRADEAMYADKSAGVRAA